jgi:hypothetical protein
MPLGTCPPAPVSAAYASAQVSPSHYPSSPASPEARAGGMPLLRKPTGDAAMGGLSALSAKILEAAPLSWPMLEPALPPTRL